MFDRWEVCVRCSDGTVQTIARTFTKPNICRFLVRTGAIRFKPEDVVIRKVTWW